METSRFKDKNVLITGGSTGIGLAVAKEFGKHGANLFLVARNPERLKNAQKEISETIPQAGKVVVFPIDVSIQKKVENSVQTILDHHGGIDILINNAGISICGRIEDHSSEDHEKVLRINYLGSLYTLKAVYPHLKTKPGSHIGFVSSVAGYLGVFGFSAYAASKFAVTGLAESIRNEAKDYGIGVTMIYPPDTDTPMYHQDIDSKLPECIALSESAKLVQPEEVAQKFLKGILKNKFEVFCNTESRLIRMLRFVLPSVYFKAVDGIIEKDRRKRKKASMS